MPEPTERNRRWGGGDSQPPAEKVIEYGTRSIGGSGNAIKRGMVQNIGGDRENVTYIGPSKMEGRSSAISGGVKQKKKHKSVGKGQ